MKKNWAFIDGQNLYLGTKKSDNTWIVDLLRFRVYLSEKYNVKKAFYYIGYYDQQNEELYDHLKESGFILIFRHHHQQMQSSKKGNVDTNIVFDCMKALYKNEDFKKIILVSGDGDFYPLVEFLIQERRFEKILFPNLQQASSLYKKIKGQYFVSLSQENIRKKIQKK